MLCPWPSNWLPNEVKKEVIDWEKVEKFCLKKKPSFIQAAATVSSIMRIFKREKYFYSITPSFSCKWLSSFLIKCSLLSFALIHKHSLFKPKCRVCDHTCRYQIGQCGQLKIWLHKCALVLNYITFMGNVGNYKYSKHTSAMSLTCPKGCSYTNSK